MSSVQCRTFSACVPVLDASHLSEADLKPGWLCSLCVVGVQAEKNAFVVADLGALMRQHLLWQNSMPQVRPFYPVRCNSSPAVIEVLAALGVGFVCANKVSPQHFFLAVRSRRPRRCHSASSLVHVLLLSAFCPQLTMSFCAVTLPSGWGLTSVEPGCRPWEHYPVRCMQTTRSPQIRRQERNHSPGVRQRGWIVQDRSHSPQCQVCIYLTISIKSVCKQM